MAKQTKKVRTYRRVWDVQPSQGEVNTLPSETVPDQSMDIRTIINRFAGGLQLPEGKTPVYSEDLPDLRGMDISQIYDLKRENLQFIKESENEIEAELAEREKNAKDEREKKLLEDAKIQWEKESKNM